jgi:dihydrodipicolinate synthase/N-acetylneuraminate lyase
VDLVRLRAAFARWVASPLTGFVVLGSNGEAALMDEEESDRVVGAARDIVPPGRAFIVGTGRESTQATLRATRRAASLGADAVLVRTPLGRLLGQVYGVAGLKAAMKMTGCDVGMPRPPLAPVPDAGLAVLREALAKFQEVAA